MEDSLLGKEKQLRNVVHVLGRALQRVSMCVYIKVDCDNNDLYQNYRLLNLTTLTAPFADVI